MSNFEMQHDEILGKIYDGRLFRRLLHFVKPYWKYLIIAFVLLLINMAGELTLPLLTRRAVDHHIVPDFKVLTLTESDFEHFCSVVETDKFQIYSYLENNFVIINSKNIAYIPKALQNEYREKGAFSDEKVIILNRADISDEMLKKIAGKYVTLGMKDGDNYLYINLSDVYKLPVGDILELRGKSISTIKLIALIYLGIVVIKFGIGFCQLVLTTIASQKAMHDLRSSLFSHLERMPVSFFDKNPVGRLVTRVTSDINAINEMLTSGVIQIIQDFFMVIAIMILMLFLNWRLALVSFIVLPAVAYLMTIFRLKTRESYRAMRKWLAQVNATLAEHISGVKIIQLFNQYRHKEDEFDSSNHKYYRAAMRQLKLVAIFQPLIGVSRNVAIAIILWYAGGQILQNMLTLGLFMAFISYMEKLYEPIHHFTEKFNILQGAMAGAERIFDLQDQMEADYREELPALAPTTTEGMGDTLLAPTAEAGGGRGGASYSTGEIEFKNVWLSYDTTQSIGTNNQSPAQSGHWTPDTGNFVLKNISFKVAPGEKIALVGHTGSGKTSIVNLILNMYPYQKGEILINGRNINQYRLSDLRSHIGMVQQDVFLFSGNIRDNIILNNKDITDEEINKITKYVNVADFINSLPHGLDEPVQERGATFSVGQRQLISFARVLAYDPAIFILDEATSNIDTETEILIQDALFKIMEHRTSIIIAHRLSTIQKVDRILVLHHGEIVEEGSHQELLRKEGLYYDLYRLQYS